MNRSSARTPPWASGAALAALAAAGLLALSPGARADPKILKKVPPDFPADALRRHVTDGVLQTKVSIDASGNVTGVDVIKATPPPARVFAAAATDALMQWKFEPSGKPDSAEIKLVFSQE